jgi:hypothetical protein
MGDAGRWAGIRDTLLEYDFESLFAGWWLVIAAWPDNGAGKPLSGYTCLSGLIGWRAEEPPLTLFLAFSGVHCKPLRR